MYKGPYSGLFLIHKITNKIVKLLKNGFKVNGTSIKTLDLFKIFQLKIK